MGSNWEENGREKKKTHGLRIVPFNSDQYVLFSPPLALGPTFTVLSGKSGRFSLNLGKILGDKVYKGVEIVVEFCCRLGI